jgi:hypothetical protein
MEENTQLVEEPIVDIDVTVKLLKEPTVETVLFIIDNHGYGSIEKLSDAVLMIRALAEEIKTLRSIDNALTEIKEEVLKLKRSETENRLLIEHEEAVRTTKAKSVSGGRNIRNRYKSNDIVDYNPIGTKIWVKSKVLSTSKSRIHIELMETKSQAGARGSKRFVGPKQLRFHVHE